MDISSVSFGAVPINSIKVKKYNKISKNFENYLVNFVRLESDCKNDMAAIDRVEQKWKGATYVKRIATSAKWIKPGQTEVYALTIQQKNFDNLKADNILGLAEMRADKDDPDNMILRYLQVRPNAMNVNQTNKKLYKYIGSSILESLKKIYSNITLFSDDDSNIENFYRKNGFVDYFNGSRHYKWSQNPFKRLLHRITKFRLENGI